MVTTTGSIAVTMRVEEKMPEVREIREFKNRQTGTVIVVDYGLNEPGMYQATCYGYEGHESHGFVVNCETLAHINSIAADPLAWCEVCQENHVFKDGVTTDDIDAIFESSIELLDYIDDINELKEAAIGMLQSGFRTGHRIGKENARRNKQ